MIHKEKNIHTNSKGACAFPKRKIVMLFNATRKSQVGLHKAQSESRLTADPVFAGSNSSSAT